MGTSGVTWVDPNLTRLNTAFIGKTRYQGWYVSDHEGLYYMRWSGEWGHVATAEEDGSFWPTRKAACDAVNLQIQECKRRSKQMRHRVYIACPISNGDTEYGEATREFNFMMAAQVYDRLLAMGLSPLNPALTIKHPSCKEIAYGVWMEVDKPWLICAEAVFRVPGPSKGADDEVQWAFEHDIPVFGNFPDIAAYFSVQ